MITQSPIETLFAFLNYMLANTWHVIVGIILVMVGILLTAYISQTDKNFFKVFGAVLSAIGLGVVTVFIADKIFRKD